MSHSYEVRYFWRNSVGWEDGEGPFNTRQEAIEDAKIHSAGEWFQVEKRYVVVHDDLQDQLPFAIL